MTSLNDLFNIKYQENIGLSGLTDESFCLLVNELFEKENKSILILTESLTDANNLLNILSTISKDVLFFPMDDFLTSEAISVSPDLMITRLETLNELIKNDKKIVITHLMAYLRYLPSKKTYFNNYLNLKVGLELEPKKLVTNLFNIGYRRETIVTKTGEIGVRGFIIDIFPVSSKNPVRIEFFGDTIESIRIFDEESQKSIESIDEITIFPYTEFLLDTYENINLDNRNQKYLEKYTNNIKNIENYLNNPIVIVKDYTSILNTYNKLKLEMETYKESDSYKGIICLLLLF